MGQVSNPMNPRERILRTFEHKSIDHLAWQPRIDHWYRVNKARKTLPERYKNSSLFEIYDDLEASPRPYDLFNQALKINYGNHIDFKREEREKEFIDKWSTPKGNLYARYRKTEWGQSYSFIEYPIKRMEDIEIMKYILKNQQVEFDKQVYEAALEEIGERAEPTLFLPRIPIQRLYIDFIGFERTIIALHRNREKVEDLMHAIEASDDEIYKKVGNSPIKIINFGDNIDCNLLPPNLFKQYALPYYKKRTKQLKYKAKYTHSHWDGSVKALLPFVKDTGLDGIEAITPKPQGDVTLEEIRENIPENMILLDLIPAILFLPQRKTNELKSFLEKTYELFGNRLVLGISDELPPDADIEKVRFASQWTKKNFI
jgi:hypothetical protein